MSVRFLLFLVSVFCIGCQRPAPVESVSKKTPQRLISLLPSATELVCAVGQEEKLVGVTWNDNFPLSVTSLPKVGDQTIDLELVLQLKPDLVILDSNFNANKEALERLGLRVLELKCHRLSDVPSAMRVLGRVLDCQELAEAEALSFESALAAIEPAALDDSIFVEVWGEPLMTVGDDNVISDVLTHLGLRNCYADQKGYFQVDPEDVVSRQPQIILLPAKSDETESSALKLCQSVGLNPKVFRIDPDLLVRPGPRLIEGMRLIQQGLKELKNSR